MKKSQKKITWFSTGVFQVAILFVYRFSYEETISHLTKIKATDWKLAISNDKTLIDGANYIALKRTIENKKTGEEKTFFYLFIKNEFKFEDYDYCVLAHEVVHLCQFILPDFLERDREIEAEAYFHTSLMQAVLKELRK